MIAKKQDIKFASFRVVTLNFYDLYNSSNFLIMSFVSNFCWNHFAREENNWVSLAIVRYKLAKNTGYDISKSIGFNRNQWFLIKMMKDIGLQ